MTNPEPRYTIDVQPGLGWTLVKPRGELDLVATGALDEALRTAVGDVIVDLSEVTFIDSGALRVLLTENRLRPFTIRDPSHAAVRLFEITGVRDWFRFEK